MFKKNLLSLALISISGTTMASTANVDFSGSVRMYVESYKAGTADAVSKVSNDNSQITFKVKEDLGGGLNVVALVDTSIAIDSPAATSLGDRRSTLSFGTQDLYVSAGRDKHSYRKFMDHFDTMGAFYGTTVDTIHSLRGSRTNNAIEVLIAPVAGSSIGYTHALSETGVDAAQSANGIFNYGDIKVGVAAYDNNAGSTSYGIGGKTELTPDITVMGIVSKDSTNGTKTTGVSGGIKYAMNPVMSVIVGYGHKPDTDAYNVKATYSLSKRTALNAMYSQVNSNIAANDVMQYGLGLQHTF
jgi:hypothetical protein